MEFTSKSDIKVEDTEESRQAARAFLRERFLKILSMEVGSFCELTTVEGNKISGIYEGTNYNTSQFLVKDLQTPMATIPDALLRANDIMLINFPSPKSLEQVNVNK